MKEMVSKVLLAGDKYMLEMHLIQPEYSYSTCGTFIKNKGRIQKFKKNRRFMIYLSKQIILDKISGTK